jgi:hypothetical protein
MNNRGDHGNDKDTKDQKDQKKMTTHFPIDYQAFQLDLLFNIKLGNRQDHELMLYDLEHIYIANKVKLSSPMIIFLLYQISYGRGMKLLTKVIANHLIANDIWTGCCIPLLIVCLEQNPKCHMTTVLVSLLMLIYDSHEQLNWKQTKLSLYSKDKLQLIFIGKTKLWKSKSNLILKDPVMSKVFSYLVNNFIEEI